MFKLNQNFLYGENIISENVKKYFKKTYYRETVFIPNGIEKPTNRKANIIKSKYNLDKDDYILFLARIVPEKGLDDLIDAYEKVNTDKKLIIAGGASHTNDYLKHIKEKVKNNKNIIEIHKNNLLLLKSYDEESTNEVSDILNENRMEDQVHQYKEKVLNIVSNQRKKRINYLL